MRSSFASALVAAALLLRSASAAGQISHGTHPPYHDLPGTIQCLCWAGDPNAPIPDGQRVPMSLEDTQVGCEKMEGVMYPDDPDTLNNCMFDNNYTDRTTQASRFANFCKSQWSQCCNTQGDETKTDCTWWGPVPPS